MSFDSGSWVFRTVVALLEWILKQVTGPDGWRPAGAIRELPPSALVHDSLEEQRADEVFRCLSTLGFAPTRVAVDSAAGDVSGICRAISRGTQGCWATVVLEPEDVGRAGKLGPAFRQYAHLHQDVVAIVIGPLPSRAEILDRYRHVVMDGDGGVSAPELSMGIAHASAARVLHCARLVNTAIVFFSLLTLVVGVAMTYLGWFVVRR